MELDSSGRCSAAPVDAVIVAIGGGGEGSLQYELEELRCSWLGMEESGGTSGRREDAAPPWRPSEASAFSRFAAAAASPEASPSASASGAAARVSSLHGVKRKPFVARLTASIIQTYLQCDPEFKYSEILNPKRFLTNSSTPAHNGGLDNANWDLILYVNLELVNKMSNRRFIVKEMLGQGTFGQVVKCWDTETNDYVAVKVIKNQRAFYHQAIKEVSLLRTLNQKFDPDDQHNIVRMLDYLSFQNHLCIAFEMLGQNLYELLKRNHLRGLKLKYVQAFSKQILDAMVVMREAGIIHCDLKPENILLAPSVATAAAVKVIDFGLACLEGKTVYSYIQSRYYRSPEVLLGYPYTTAIDMWSFGCVVAELFLGLPLFPGASEYDVLQRMMKILGGQPPDELLREAKNTIRFFKHVGSIYPGNEAPTGLSSAYRILSEEEVEVRDSKRPKMGKWYFPHLKLDKLICTYPWNNSELTETEKTDRLGLVDFLKGLLEFDPNKRWSPLQALYHPFITGESFTGPYEPVPEPAKIPVARAAAIDHNPGGGHWLYSGLSPQVGSVNRYLPLNNAYPPKVPFSCGSSYGSYGSHGSYTGNPGFGNSYVSTGDVDAINIYYSPLGSPGLAQIGSSPDVRLRMRLPHDRGIRLSPGSLGPLSLGASPSQFTPPNYQMQIPANSTGKHGSGSPASGGIHGSPLGKAPYNMRNLPMPPHDYVSQHGQGRFGDGVSFSHSDAYARGHTGHSHNAAGRSSCHSGWRPQIGSRSGISLEASSSHVSSQALSQSFDFSASSELDPANWDPNYSDESLLQEDNSLSADLSSNLHFGDAMFHKIMRTRTEILDGSNLKNRLQVTDTVHRPIGMETLVNRGMSTGENSPVIVTKLLDQGQSVDISAAPSQQQRLMTSAHLVPQPEPGINARRSMMRLPDRGPQARVPTKHPLSVAEGPQESSIEGTTDSSHGTLEAPVSLSLGAMGSLLKKLSLLLAPNYPLRRSLRHAIKLLEEDLEEIRDALMEQSMVDYNKNKVKYWMEEVRELLYDIEDSIDVMMFSHTAAYATSRSIHGHSHRVFSRTRRRAADRYIKNKSHRQRVARLKIHRLPNILKLSTRVTKVSELRALLWEASERHERYQLDGCISNPTFLSYIRTSRIPVSYKVVHNLIGIEDPKKEITMWLTNQSEQQLKVLCIVGPLGVGKTTLAKELYRELSGQFECRALVRVSQNPDIGRLLQELFSQIQWPKQSSDACSLQGIIDKISNHLQDKRYFIVIDDLCEAEAWDLMKNAFPKSNKCSRIIVTGEVQNVGAECSGDIFELKPLCSQDSEKLFLGRVFSSEDQCPDSLKDTSCRMLKECGGLPLAIITLAGLFASLRNNSDIWHQLQRYVVSSLTNLSLEYMLKQIVNLCCDNLPQDLKTCLLYLTIYPEGCTIWKVDLLKQWTAEGFITSTKGNEGVAESYFDELVKRGMIQPEKITHNNEVLSCTVHHIVLDLIIRKSREENFITAVDYSQTNALFFMKPRRLSLHFSCAQYATKPEGIRLSQVRSLAFFGFPKCMPSVMEFKVLRVLIIEFRGNKDDFSSFDLSRICRLVLLRYLKISGHIFVDFPSKIQGLKLLETLEIFARVSTTLNEKAMEIDAKESALPNDIVHLPGLLHLSLQEGIKLPDRIGLLTSLQTLKHYDFGKNSEDCTQSLGELKNLRDLQLTCSTALSHEHLKRNLVALASSLGRLTNLESLTLAHGAVGMTMFVEHSSAVFSTSKFLQRLEVLQSTCVFSSLPEWIGKLCRLSILKIVVRVLIRSDIDILTRLPGLTVLSLYVRQPSIERVVFHNGALPVLKYFKYSCSALCIDFQEAALPNLHRLKLCFNVYRGEIYSHTICTIKHLSNLKGIALRIGAAAGVEESDRRAAESAFVSSIHKHPMFPIYMNIRRVDCVDE